MPKSSAGLLLYRRVRGGLQVLLVHPGGPFWAKKDLGSWSIPKGEFAAGEDPLEAAQREFREETGFAVKGGDYLPLAPLKQPGGKIIHAWAVAEDCDPSRLQSNTFSIEWPPRSGLVREFPEVDRAAWFPLAEARRRIAPGQVGFLDQLAAAVGQRSGPSSP
jgi:predicted NUDIX family NTP pyrophosphohydrolase